MAAALLEVAELHAYRGRAHVVHGVSLRVNADEAVSLVGRNGAGKTSTIEAIMGLLPVRSGFVLFNGFAITALPAHERARAGIGYAPEDAGVFPDLTIRENFRIAEKIVLAGRHPARERKAVEAAVFELFPEIRAFLSRRGLNLSGGQKKMVAIARALTLRPSILLLDEPFEGLAPAVVNRFIEAVRRIKAMGISLLIAESNLPSAVRVADRLYAIDRGEIVFEGKPEAIFDREEVMKTLRG